VAARLQVHPYALDMAFLLCSCKWLQQSYEQKGLPLQLFYDTMWDLSSKAEECLANYGVWGTSVIWWYDGFFDMTRFALGRLQFEPDVFRGARYCAGGYTVHRGDPVYACHIPSGLPLTPAACLDALQKAHRFYGFAPGQPMAVTCDSWLLFPWHRTMLGQGSNMVAFLNLFTVLRASLEKRFGEHKRVYGAAGFLPPAQWPADTTLQRVYRARVLDGKYNGGGYGILLFDGEKVLPAQTPGL